MLESARGEAARIAERYVHNSIRFLQGWQLPRGMLLTAQPLVDPILYITVCHRSDGLVSTRFKCHRISANIPDQWYYTFHRRIT